MLHLHERWRPMIFRASLLAFDVNLFDLIFSLLRKKETFRFLDLDIYECTYLRND